MAEKHIVAGLTLQADQPIQKLEDLRAAEERFSTQGRNTATSLSTGYGEIEERVAKMHAKLSAGNNVSEAEFTRLVSKLAALRQAVEDTGVPLEQMPEEFRAAAETANAQMAGLAQRMVESREAVALVRAEFDQLAESTSKAGEYAEEAAEKYADLPARLEEIRSAADRTFEEQIDDLKRIQSELKDSEKAYDKMGDQGKEALKVIQTESARVETAIKELRKESSVASGEMRDGFVLADRAFTGFDQGIREGSPRVVSELSRVILTTRNLRESIDATRAAGGVVTDEQLAQMRAYDARLESAKEKVRKLTDELQEQKSELGEGGERWSGLGDAINKALGPMGKFQAQLALGAAAFREGWQAGMQFNQLIGTDMSEWEKLIARWGAKTKIVLEEVSDHFVAMGGVMKAFLIPGEGYAERLQAAFNRLKNETEEGVRKFSDLDAAVRKATKAHEDAVRANQAHAEAAKLLISLSEKLKAAKEQELEAERDLTREIQKQNIEYEKAKQLRGYAEAMTPGAKNESDYLARQLADLKQQYEEQLRAIKQLSEEYGAFDPHVTRATETLTQLGGSLRIANERYDESKNRVEKLADQWGLADAAIQKHREDIQKNAETQAANELKNMDALKKQRKDQQEDLEKFLKTLLDSQKDTDPRVIVMREAIRSLDVAIAEAGAQYDVFHAKAERLNLTFAAIDPAISIYQEMVRKVTEGQSAGAASAQQMATATDVANAAAQKATTTTTAQTEAAGKQSEAIRLVRDEHGHFVASNKKVTESVDEVSAANQRWLDRNSNVKESVERVDVATEKQATSTQRAAESVDGVSAANQRWLDKNRNVVESVEGVATATDKLATGAGAVAAAVASVVEASDATKLDAVARSLRSIADELNRIVTIGPRAAAAIREVDAASAEAASGESTSGESSSGGGAGGGF